jgi:uncharacterized membrane protein
MKKNNRIAEIDALRGAAVLDMIYYHLMYDLVEFYHFSFPLSHITMQITSLAAPLFFILAGISSQFGRNPWKQILKLLLAAGLITFITYLQNPQHFVRFGTLHFLACAMILLVPLRKMPTSVLLFVAGLAIVTGSLFSRQTTIHPWLFPFGLRSSGFQSSDYFPLLPYFAYPLVGLLLGRRYYSKKISLFPDFHQPVLEWIGRHSLYIYLLHQPVILTLLYLWYKL